MKTFRLFLFALPLLFVSCGGEEQKTAAAADNKTPEGTAQMIAGYVIANDADGLVSMIISKEEMTAAISASNAPPEGKEFAIGRVEEEIRIMQGDIKKGLDQVRAGAAGAGIVWAEAKFKSVTPKIDEKRGFQMMSMVCVIESDGKEFKFSVTDIVGTDNGWKLAGKMYSGDGPPPAIQLPIQGPK